MKWQNFFSFKYKWDSCQKETLYRQLLKIMKNDLKMPLILRKVSGAAKTLIGKGFWIIVTHKANNFIVLHIHKVVRSMYVSLKNRRHKENINNHSKNSTYMFISFTKKQLFQSLRGKKRRKEKDSRSSNLHTVSLLTFPFNQFVLK